MLRFNLCAMVVLAVSGLGCEGMREQLPPRIPPRIAGPPRPTRVNPGQPHAGTTLSRRITKRGRSHRVTVHGAARVRRGDHVDVLATVKDNTQQPVTVLLLQDLIVLDHDPPGQVALLVLPEEAEGLALTARIAPMMMVARRQADDAAVVKHWGQIQDRHLWVESGQKADRLRRMKAFQRRLAASPRRPPRGPVQGARELCLPLAGARGVVSGDHLDLLATLRDPHTKDWIATTLLSNVVVSGTPKDGCTPLLLLPRECARAVHALRQGALSASLRNPGDDACNDEQTAVTSRALVVNAGHPGCRFPSRPTIQKIEVIRGVPVPARPQPRPTATP